MSDNISTGPKSRFWLPILLALAFVLLNASGWWYYQTSHRSLSDAVGKRLRESTKLVADGLNHEQFAYSAILFDPEADIYLDSMFREAETSGQFAALHLLSPIGENWFETSGEDELDGAQMLAAAAGSAFDSAAVGVVATSGLYRSRDLYFLAACAPVFDSDSSVVAVVAAEAGNDYFSALHGLRSGLILLDAFAGLLFLTIGLIWAGVQRRLARAEKAALRSAQLAAMGQMVATVAHELKNPLGIIKNSAERIKRKYGTPDEPLFDFIPEEVDRLDSLLRRYLQFARLEVAATESVDLGSFAERLQSQLAAKQDDGFTLTVRVPAGLRVYADPDALRQIVLNLVLNAFEACRQNSGGEVSLFASLKGQAVEIVVSDTGVGMDKDTLRQASEPFFTTRADGSGLGIYLAQTLTEKMNGRMTIRSRVGEGTSVSLTLPVDSAD